MWLFDELLKKPTANPPADSGSATSDTSGPTDQWQSGSGYTPPAADPLAAMTPPPIQIQKTEEVSIITESAADTASDTPPPVTAVAVDDVSSILISSDTPAPAPVIITEDISMTPAPIVTTPSESLIGNVEVTEVAPTIVKSQGVMDLWNLFADEEIVPPAVSPTITDTVGTNNESSPSILWGLWEESASSALDAMMSDTPQQEATDATATIADTEDILEDAHSILGEDTSVTVQSEAIETIGSLISEVQDVAEETEESYEHPSEFITASIARIDAMITRIDTAHGTKLSEALGYKTEKEKYTTLEEQAYADAEKYVIEKDHALAMRTYFVEQGKATDMKIEVKASEPVASVETTLTGLAVQNAVSETVKHEKKTKAKKEEESIWLLGL